MDECERRNVAVLPGSRILRCRTTQREVSSMAAAVCDEPAFRHSQHRHVECNGRAANIPYCRSRRVGIPRQCTRSKEIHRDLQTYRQISDACPFPIVGLWVPRSHVHQTQILSRGAHRGKKHQEAAKPGFSVTTSLSRPLNSTFGRRHTFLTMMKASFQDSSPILR